VEGTLERPVKGSAAAASMPGFRCEFARAQLVGIGIDGRVRGALFRLENEVSGLVEINEAGRARAVGLFADDGAFET
jgi:hypothetical protein